MKYREPADSLPDSSFEVPLKALELGSIPHYEGGETVELGYEKIVNGLPSRHQEIYREVNERPMSVEELSKKLGRNRSNVNRDLKDLRKWPNNGILDDEETVTLVDRGRFALKNGGHIYYHHIPGRELVPEEESERFWQFD